MKGIYKVTTPTNKVYIGQSIDIIKRFSYYKNLHCKNQVKLYNSLLKHSYKKHVFEIIHELPDDISQINLNNYEKLYIQLYRDCNVEVLNLTSGGSNGSPSEETKNKIRDTLSGIPLSYDRKCKISKSIKKLYINGHYNNLIRNINGNRGNTKGKKYPKGNRPSKETLKVQLEKLNLIQISKIYNTSPPTIKNWIIDYNLIYNRKRYSKKIIEKDLITDEIRTFDSITVAAKFYNKDISTISDRVKNKTIFNNKILILQD